MNAPRILITRYGIRYWAVFLDGELLAVTLYLKGARAIQAAILKFTKLSNVGGKEGNHATQAA